MKVYTMSESPQNKVSHECSYDAIPDELMVGPWITEHEENIVLNAIRDGWYGNKAYQYVEAFEPQFAAWHDRRFGLMTPNCTHAIHLGLSGLGVGPGDEVIVPEVTWIATVAPITYCGAVPVFCDVDPNTWCATSEAVARCIGPRTKAIIIVDLYGNMPNWDDLKALSKKSGIPILEDSAEALGSSYQGEKAGGFGKASVFSFHRTKTITTGEGGIILTDDPALFERCKILRDHGRAPGSYYNTEVAFKYMPSNLQASLALAQFQRIDELVGRKRAMLNRYREQLSGLPVTLNTEPQGGQNGAWCTTLIFDEETKIDNVTAKTYLDAHMLPSRPFFYPLTALPAFASHTNGGPERNPVAYSLSKRGIILPSSFRVTDAQIDQYSSILAKLF